jgi:hypothetical protein
MNCIGWKKRNWCLAIKSSNRESRSRVSLGKAFMDRESSYLLGSFTVTVILASLEKAFEKKARSVLVYLI